MIPEKTRQAIRAVCRDRAGIDRRLLEIGAEMQALMDEREALKAQRKTNQQIADDFGICASAVHYVMHGRL